MDTGAGESGRIPCPHPLASSSSPLPLRSHRDLAGVLGTEVDVTFQSISDDQTLRQTCHDEEANCRTTIETPNGGLDTCELSSTACTAPIGDYEACFNDTIAALGPALAKLPSCDTLTLANVETLDSTPKQPDPPSCQTFEAECPGGFAALRFGGSGASSSKLPQVDLDGGAVP